MALKSGGEASLGHNTRVHAWTNRRIHLRDGQIRMLVVNDTRSQRRPLQWLIAREYDLSNCIWWVRGDCFRFCVDTSRHHHKYIYADCTGFEAALTLRLTSAPRERLCSHLLRWMRLRFADKTLIANSTAIAKRDNRPLG